MWSQLATDGTGNDSLTSGAYNFCRYSQPSQKNALEIATHPLNDVRTAFIRILKCLWGCIYEKW